MRNTRSSRKRGKTQKQRGYGRTPENYAKLEKKFEVLKQNLANIQEQNDFPLQPINNGKYTEFKKSVIPIGTRFFFRSKIHLTELENRPIWLDYSGRVSKQSFLVDPLNPENLPPEIPNAMIRKFGDWLIEVETIEPVVILHFPVDYSSQDASLEGHSYSAFFEPLIKHVCVHKKLPENYSRACADGYTLDFYFKELKGKFKGQGWIPGYRELCIYNPVDKLRIIGQHYRPIREIETA